MFMFILLFCISALYIGQIFHVFIPNSGHYFPFCPQTITIYLFFGQKQEEKKQKENLSSQSNMALFQCIQTTHFSQVNGFSESTSKYKLCQTFPDLSAQKITDRGISFQNQIKLHESTKVLLTEQRKKESSSHTL